MTGGGNGRKHSDTTREKMSKSRTGMIKSTVTKEKIGSSRKKNNDDPNLQIALQKLNLEVLPTYIYYIKSNQSIQFSIKKQKVNKIFGGNITLDEKIRLAIEYKNSLTTTDVGSS